MPVRFGASLLLLSDDQLLLGNFIKYRVVPGAQRERFLKRATVFIARIVCLCHANLISMLS